MNEFAFDQDDETEDPIDPTDWTRYRQAVVFSTDWTVETVIGQLRRGNILLNPRFQRRDAWTRAHKSRFIESLILGLPVPQLVLAETKDQRGKYLVLDGKQRLLALLQFWGLGEGEKNNYRLTGVEVRTDLKGLRLQDLENSPELRTDLDALQNQTIRTVVVRNWPDNDFLHEVFLRLNTNSVRLSPQELRQALYPGQFSDYVDERAEQSEQLKLLLRLKEPDFRMRDIELLARFMSFAMFFETYPGRMKKFLDTTFEIMNREWSVRGKQAEDLANEFDEAVRAAIVVFGKDEVARKPGTRPFNKAIFDGLAYFLRLPEIRDACMDQRVRLRSEYTRLFENREFLLSIESDTAGTPNTVTRFRYIGEMIQQVTGIHLALPRRAEGSNDRTVILNGP